MSVQWWIVVDHYAEQPFLPELPLLTMQSGAYKADIIKQRWWKDKVIHCSYTESKPQKFLKSLRSSNDCIRSQTEIPYMTGWTASEGGFMVSLLYDSLEETGADWDSVGPFFTGLTINQVRGHWFQSVLHL